MGLGEDVEKEIELVEVDVMAKREAHRHQPKP